MKKAVIGLSVVAGLAIAVVGGTFMYAKSALGAKRAAVHETHTQDFPVPWPLSEAEVEALRTSKLAELEAAGAPTQDDAGEPIDVLADVDLDALALAQAIERGEHLVQSRYFCVECHGQDFSGGVMIDAPPMGAWLGPNLTQGEGSKTVGHTPTDWDRIVRHGVKKDGTAAIMPSEDFIGMSDQELSDIVAYVGSFPPIDNVVPDPTFGPVSTMLVGFEQIHLSAEAHAGTASHLADTPVAEESAAFGEHLTKVCVGCHRAEMNGGPILAGDPSWPPSTNLTPSEDGIAHYDYAAFETMMRTGVKPDGTQALAPMDLIQKYSVNLTDTEVKAMWAYLQSLEPKATGQ